VSSGRITVWSMTSVGLLMMELSDEFRYLVSEEDR
jgi:hypothetical protein